MNNEIGKTFSSSVTAASLAAIISVTPIVSIAGSTLSEITTTTTSTTTTPTPTPTSSEPIKADDDFLPANPMSDAAAKTTAGGGAAATGNATGALKKESTPPLATGKTDEATNEAKSKKSESWEESRLKDWDDIRLKKLLEEAYSYKNPRDKANKSDIFLELLQKAENEKEDQTFFHALTSRYTRNSSSSTTSNSQHHHHHHHHHKQGGSLQDLVDPVRFEPLLDCDFVGGGHRNRRHNHNSRQKKYSSVSSRQREGGSLPSNVNVTNCGGLLGGGTLDQPPFMHEVKTGVNSKQQRRNAKGAAAVTVKETEQESVGGGSANCNDIASGTHGVSSTCGASGDCVIEIGEPMMDIQQQMHTLQSKSQDPATQGLPYYDRLDNIDVRIPRANISHSMQSKTDFAPSSAQCYVDETVRFTTMERSAILGASVGAASIGPHVGSVKASSTIDSNYLPLDENYKSCKSVLGGEKSEMSKTPATMFSTTKTITTYSNISSLPQRQYDENGNSLNEIYQTGAQAAAAIMNASAGGVNASASCSASVNSGQSQAKAKSKKKSQQDRNTKTVDVESVAGYRGKDPVEVLVKYIESSEDKQNDTKSNSSRFNENSKKKDRKKDKEKQHKLKKKSNSLEELRSCSKIDVDDLKRTAATTESNVMMRNKGGANGNKSNQKNNSSSTADINKNFENANVKELPATTTATVAVAGVAIKAIATNSVATNRKGERRSWGTEELQYLGDTNSSNDEKAKEKKNNKNKEKDPDKEVKEPKDQKEKVSSSEKNEKNLIITAEIITMPPTKVEKPERPEKLEKVEKRKKSESSASSAPVTIVDILAMDSLVPETAEFHVVTKKRKPKKQRASLDETSSSGGNSVTVVSFNRTHNFITNMQKSTTATFGQQQSQQQQQQQQQQPQQSRYKYYNSHTGAANNEPRSVDYIGSYHNNNNNHYNNTNYSHATNHHYHQDGQHHQHQHVASGGDKSRRKSTSSVPPSEKSDSSDLDSVHSLPVESSKKQRHKNTAATQSTSSSSKNVANNNSPAPISYADIARTNKELAAAADSNGSGTDKWPAVDAANANNVAVDSSPSMTDETQISNATSQMNVSAHAAAVSNPAKLKVKKTASKPDFPELVATTTTAAAAAAIVSAPIPLEIVTIKMNAFKPISYSQSLTTAPANAVVTMTSTISDVTPATATAATEIVEIENKHTEKRYPASEQAKTESAIVNNVFGVTRQQQLHQHQHQQQPLQKSKSVEHESYNYNSTNLDQQYPALEKTVKRHSATNVAIAIATNAATTTASAAASVAIPPTATAAQFNFAAAAKQQTNACSETLPKSATSTTSGNPATAVVTAPVIPYTGPNAVAVRKSKEKSPNPTANSNSASLVGGDILANNPQSNAATSAVVMRKSKKEKLHQMQVADSGATTESQKFSTATQTNATSISNKVRSQPPSTNNVTATIACKATNAISNKINKTNAIAQSTTTSTTTNNKSTTASANRPAVIILNFDRAIGASNDFTFGDFNEEELKFFDDDIADGENIADMDVAYEDDDDVALDYVDIDDDEDEEEPQHFSFPLPSAAAASKAKLSPHAVTTAHTQAATFFNDSGASSDVVNNSTQHSDDIMLLSSADASSPNTSFVAVSHGGNQSSDSGIYTTSNKSKSNNSNISNNSSKRPSPGKDAANKLNSFLNAPTVSATAAQSTSKAEAKITTTLTEQSTSASSKSCPPPQQLETCNDIETAIIAAARAAAEQQQQQQQYQNQKSNSSSNSSSFSSSSSVSVDAKYPPQSPSATTKASANHYSHAHERRQSHQYDEELDEQTSRSRSHSRQRGVAPPASLVVSIQRKEFDIHFIPPTMSTAFSSLQHNEIIVDFIGSAWEEVANSKVTKFYDGQ